MTTPRTTADSPLSPVPDDDREVDLTDEPPAPPPPTIDPEERIEEGTEEDPEAPSDGRG